MNTDRIRVSIFQDGNFTRLRKESDSIKRKYPFPQIGVIGGVSLPDNLRQFSVILGRALIDLLQEGGSLFSCGTGGVGYIVLDQAFECLDKDSFRKKVFTLVPHNAQPSYLDANTERLGRNFDERDFGMTRFFADILLSVGGESYNPNRRLREDVDRTELQLEGAYKNVPLILFADTGGETERYAKRLNIIGYPKHRIKIIHGHGLKPIEEAISFIKNYFSHIYL
ncbi:MAG: hypothetical protein ACUVTL_06105 [Thermoproteota archaeon]